MCECVQAKGVNNADLGYYNSARVTDTAGILRANLTQSAAGFLSGCDGIKSTSDITFNKLCFGKLSACTLTKNALADIRMGLGWNFCCDEDYHFGLSIIGAAPTGNKPDGCYLFEPIVGNGRHWELGAGLSGHWTFWRDECEERSCAFYLDANVTHMFKAKQCRTFDLCGKPLSRYMLAAKMKSTIADDLVGGATAGVAVAPSAQFDGKYTPVANLTHQEVDVSVGAQGDIALMFQYLHCNWSFDLGYEFWIRSCEKISARCNCCPGLTNDTTWVLKGDAYMYGYNAALTDATKTALSASQSEATICAGTNAGTAVSGYANTGVDNRQLAWRSTTALYTGAAADRVYTSINPVFITNSLIDICGAATRGNSHKIFANFDYTWCEQDCYVPYLGLGGEVEFGCKCCDNCNSCGTTCGTTCCTTSCNTTCNPCNTSCNTSCGTSSCQCCAVSQWGIWVKGGFAFN